MSEHCWRSAGEDGVDKCEVCDVQQMDSEHAYPPSRWRPTPRAKWRDGRPPACRPAAPEEKP